MDNFETARTRFDSAEKDISSIEYLQTMYPLPVEKICYHAHLAAEKFLKGFLILNGYKKLETVDLISLNNLCIECDKEFTGIEKECMRLTNFCRNASTMDLTTADMKIAIKTVEKIKDFVLTKAYQG